MNKQPFKTPMTEEELYGLGLTGFGYLPVSEIQFAQDVRTMCENNQCGCYGTTWACPPGVGTLEECIARCQAYNDAFVFATKYTIEDSFDFEGMMEGGRQFKDICTKVQELLEKPFLILGSESCQRCGTCTYPDAPCRFPDTIVGTAEGYGIWVTELAKSTGIPYNGGPNTVTYFGVVFYNRK